MTEPKLPRANPLGLFFSGIFHSIVKLMEGSGYLMLGATGKPGVP